MGYCAGYDIPGYMNPGGYGGFRRGYRGGVGYGRGRGNGIRYRWRGYYRSDLPEASEKTFIENEIKALKDQLSFLEQRLSQLGEEESK